MSGLEKPVCVWPISAELGEGACWHAPSKSVYFVDIKGCRVYRYADDGSLQSSWCAPSQVGFVLPIQGGGFVCGLEDGLYRFDEHTGRFSLLQHVEADVWYNRFNDGYTDESGALWFGSMDNREREATGSLYRRDPKGGIARIDSGYVVTNGPAMSPDGKTLYHTDTLEKTIYAFDRHPDGRVENKRVFTVIRGSGYPDGMAVDAHGVVWVALFGGSGIEKYSPAGQSIGRVDFPCSNVTKLAFGGPDGRTAYATTARMGLSAAQLEAEPLAGGLFSFRVETPGLAQHECVIEETV